MAKGKHQICQPDDRDPAQSPPELQTLPVLQEIRDANIRVADAFELLLAKIERSNALGR